MTEQFEVCEGGCTCRDVRYQVRSAPLIVHCCHCRWCQRQTGTAFATNALIEADRIAVISGEVENIIVDSPSGNGQRIARCKRCKIALWSEYLRMTDGIQDLIYFIRVGTLDNPALMSPDVHIYTSTKVPWVVLPSGIQAVDEYYDTMQTWSPQSLKRRAALIEKMDKLTG